MSSMISVDFTKSCGKMKPMHAVNNGPVYKFTEDQRITNIDAFRDAGIPFARNHDASFCAAYGGEHTVDIIAVFPDFSKDENDPASYDFCLTDEYIKVTAHAGVETFYRFGSKIEHAQKKYGTLPPPDFSKWARICEHIIRHYNEGWADGFHYGLRYWEIWNEPDLVPDSASYVDKKTWGGTKLQFFDLFEITAKHLKECFPALKIGGPAVCFPITGWSKDFLAFCRDRRIPLDFFSWHMYSNNPRSVADVERKTREMLDAYGFTSAESILDEWNYISGWTGENWISSLRAEKGLKGSSYTAAVMTLSQYQPLDILMYYDARPCPMNGLFATDFVCDKLKGYYPFYMFNRLYQAGTAVPVSGDDDTLMACAASGNGRQCLMLTYFDDDCSACEKEITITFSGIKEGSVLRATALDKDRDNEVIREEKTSGTGYSITMTIPVYTTLLLELS